MLTKESLTIKRFLDKQPRGKGSLEYRKLYNFLEKKEVFTICSQNLKTETCGV